MLAWLSVSESGPGSDSHLDNLVSQSSSSTKGGRWFLSSPHGRSLSMSVSVCVRCRVRVVRSTEKKWASHGGLQQ